MPQPSVLLIEGSDFETFPVGGQLTMARSLIKVFGRQLALVGVSRGAGPVGCWSTKQLFGHTYPFFPVCTRDPGAGKPLIPARLTFYAALRRFRAQILSLGCRAAFIQAPEALLAVRSWEWESLCYRFAGVESTLRVSRYPFAKALSGLFDKAVFAALEQHASVILATADDAAIERLVARSKGRLCRQKLTRLPTCVDLSVFRPGSAELARAELGLPPLCPMFVAVGRIGRFKGWELLLDSFQLLLARSGDARLHFVGDGEDRTRLQSEIEARGLTGRVHITGFQNADVVAKYLNAANTVVCGSFQEGWSVAMVEALASGKAIVSTDVSGVEAMIKPGENGRIVRSRNAGEFASAMEESLHLKNATTVSTAAAAEFDIVRVTEKLADLWPPLRQDNQPNCLHVAS